MQKQQLSKLLFEKLLSKLKNEKQENGQGGQELQEIIDQMNKIETDLVNKKLDSEMITRQQDIPYSTARSRKS